MNRFLPNSILTKDVSRLDDNATSLGIPKSLLMECAGLQATNKLCEKFHLNKQSLVFIFAGTGNNGGDGFVIARHLATRNIKVVVFLFGDESKIRTEESRLNWNLINTLELNISIEIVKDSKDIPSSFQKFADPTIICDALLGTGVIGDIREPISSAINTFNSFQCPKIAIDVPTGVDPDTGLINHKAINYDFRITFHAEKKGLSTTENVWIAPIGIPIEAELFVGDGDLIKVLKKRKIDAHKGQYGKILIIGGSETYSGAPSLAGRIALELGIDLVTLFVPLNKANVIRSYSSNFIVYEGLSSNISVKDISIIKNLSNSVSTVIIGPGMGQSEESIELLSMYLPWIKEQNIPCVIDADAIKILGTLVHKKNFSFVDAPWVITPHLVELQKIVNVDQIPLYSAFIERGNFLLDKTQHLGGTFLVKGVFDYIIGPKNSKTHSFRVNRTGCAEMSVGGTGDILAGIVGSFMSIGNSCFDSACCGAYLNGKLGEFCSSYQNKRIKATDLIDTAKTFLHSKKL